MIKTFLFDLGNVIMVFSHDRMFRQIADLCGLDFEAVKEFFIDQGVGLAYERGAISSQEVHQLACEKAGKEVDFDAFMDAGSNIFFPRDEVITLLHDLKKRGYRLILLSNTSEAHYRFISKRYSFLSLFDGLTLSFQVGVAKPNVAIYTHALNLAKCSPEECFYIDDIPEYVAAAEKLGIQGHIFQSPSHLVKNLREYQILP